MNSRTDSLVPVAPQSSTQLVARAAVYAEESKSAATRAVYETSFHAFLEWANENGQPALPTTLAALTCYCAAMADRGYAVATINKAVAGIASVHHDAGHDMPRGRAMAQVMAGIRRRLGVKQARKSPILVDDLRKMVAVSGLRDRALLLVGFLGAFRRSELAGICVEDVKWVDGGIEILLRRSKTDQDGAGRVVGLPYAEDPRMCPCRALAAWLVAGRISTGRIFTVNGHSVARIVKAAAEKAGVEGDFSGHSLRAGFVTSAAAAGHSLQSMMQQTGHRSIKTIQGYIRHASVWADNGAKGLL